MYFDQHILPRGVGCRGKAGHIAAAADGQRSFHIIAPCERFAARAAYRLRKIITSCDNFSYPK
jgi:hypothetical protein